MMKVLPAFGLLLVGCTAQQPEATEPPCAAVAVDEWIDVSRPYEPSADGGLKYRNGGPGEACTACRESGSVSETCDALIDAGQALVHCQGTRPCR